MENHIQKIRWELNLSLKKLAMKSGVSKTTIWRLENEGLNPSLKVAHSISNALGRSIYDVFVLEDRREGSD